MLSRLVGDPVLRTIGVVAALHFMQSVLVPVVLALLISLALSPVVERLKLWGLRRGLAIALSVLLGVSSVGVVGWLVTGQLVVLAKVLPAQKDRILARTRTLGPIGAVLRESYERFQETIETSASTEIPEPLQPAEEQAAAKREAAAAHGDLLNTLKALLMTLAGTLGNLIIVMVLVLFFLVNQEDLSVRGLRILTERGIHLSRSALTEMGGKISKYLLAEGVVNACYGVLIGGAMLLFGLQQPLFWGLLAFLFRFIPYVGTWIVAFMAMLISLGISDSWGKPIGILGFWVALEIVTADLVEPFVYGRRTEITSIGVVLSALFWSWLWGVIGLIMATPLTAALAVLGAHLPSLRWLHLLVASETSDKAPA